MRKTLIPIALAGTILLGGCASYGSGGLLGDIFNNDGNFGGDYSDRFERDAVNACGREASRFGRIAIRDVDRNRDSVRVRGQIDVRDRRGDEFICIFSSNGRITQFRRY